VKRYLLYEYIKGLRGNRGNMKVSCNLPWFIFLVQW